MNGRTIRVCEFRVYLGREGSKISNSNVILPIINAIYTLMIWQKLTTMYPEERNHTAFHILNKEKKIPSFKAKAVGLCIYL